jgi:hypothetical protein
MIQFLLMLLGFGNPTSNINTAHNTQSSVTVQNSNDLEENLETGGDIGPVLPPKK